MKLEDLRIFVWKPTEFVGKSPLFQWVYSWVLCSFSIFDVFSHSFPSPPLKRTWKPKNVEADERWTFSFQSGGDFVKFQLFVLLDFRPKPQGRNRNCCAELGKSSWISAISITAGYFQLSVYSNYWWIWLVWKGRVGWKLKTLRVCYWNNGG